MKQTATYGRGEDDLRRKIRILLDESGLTNKFIYSDLLPVLIPLIERLVALVAEARREAATQVIDEIIPVLGSTAYSTTVESKLGAAGMSILVLGKINEIKDRLSSVTKEEDGK